MKKAICRLYIKLYLKRVLSGQRCSFNDFKRYIWCIKQIMEA